MSATWILVLVTLVACGDPTIEVIGQGFSSKDHCERGLESYAKNQGPPAPGSQYTCKELR